MQCKLIKNKISVNQCLFVHRPDQLSVLSLPSTGHHCRAGYTSRGSSVHNICGAMPQNHSESIHWVPSKRQICLFPKAAKKSTWCSVQGWSIYYPSFFKFSPSLTLCAILAFIRIDIMQKIPFHWGIWAFTYSILVIQRC